MNRERVVLAINSGTEDLFEEYLGKVKEIAGAMPIVLFAESPMPGVRWVPYFPYRTQEQNRSRLRDALKDYEVVYAAMILQPRQPYWKMRALAFSSGARRILCFNENLDHFALHPRSGLAMLRHMWWRTRNLVQWEINPGGSLYTQIWRLKHPKAYRRPALYRRVLAAGRKAAERKRALQPVRDPDAGAALPAGITVIVPSRDGRELLGRLLPGLVREIAGIESEIIIADNGSTDGTSAWLAKEYPRVRVIESEAPLGFAKAVNAGIADARYSHTCVLNNDMELRPGFFPALLRAFDEVPELFCATAQIFFPEGVRREETGKAVTPEELTQEEYPVRCEDPVEGENYSYVAYGSGGCSLYDTRMLRQLRGFRETFQPAYVEDHDLGHRAWLRGWPTVFVADAQTVHHHRSTTKRYFDDLALTVMTEVHYLKHLAGSIADPELFRELWERAMWRLNVHAAKEPPPKWAFPSMQEALNAPEWVEAPPEKPSDERLILALGSGDVANFPGRQSRRSGRECVLVASSYVPFPLSHGGAVRMYNLMRRAAQEFDQVLIAYVDEFFTPAPELLEICREVVLVRRRGTHLRAMTDRPEVVEEHDTPAFRAALKELIRKHSPALVQLEFTQMGLFAEDCNGLPTILVEHDITVDLYGQLLQQQYEWEVNEQYKRWVKFEADRWRKVSCVVAMSERDRAMVEGARRVEVLANGVDLQRFQPSDDAPEPKRILFLGSFAHLPNLLALDFFLRESWPALRAEGARLHVIAGARPEHYRELHSDRVKVDLSDPRIDFEGFVSDVRSAYRKAEVVIAPLLASAGTNIKIMEAMAMGKAIVSTPAGINGLELSPGCDVIVVQTGVEMAAEISKLFADAPRRQRIERAARATVVREFNWDAIADRQAVLYRSLITSRVSSTRR